jgi:uncharacterized protein YjbJ (UPF0337 family)
VLRGIAKPSSEHPSPGIVLQMPLRKEGMMEKEHVEGAIDKTKGAVKDAAGKVMGDEKLQAEGKADKAKGAVNDAAGDMKDAVHRANDSVNKS